MFDKKEEDNIFLQILLTAVLFDTVQLLIETDPPYIDKPPPFKNKNNVSPLCLMKRKKIAPFNVYLHSVHHNRNAILKI